MGKKLIIKGADFSVNRINDGDVPEQVSLYQGALNATSGDLQGSIIANTSVNYPNRVFTKHTIEVPAGSTIGFRQYSGLNIPVAGICVYNRNLSFNQASSTVDTTPHPYCTSGTAYSSNPPALNTFTYTNTSTSTVYIGLVLKKTDGTNITPSEVGNIEVLR
jgi:hypothetical protein